MLLLLGKTEGEMKDTGRSTTWQGSLHSLVRDTVDRPDQLSRVTGKVWTIDNELP